MEKYKKEKIVSKRLSLESPNQCIKSTIFHNKKDIIRNSPNFKNRRAFTPNFLLNQIGYIKKDYKYEYKKINLEEDKKLDLKNTSNDINKLVNKILLNHKKQYNFETYTKTKDKNENFEIKDKNCTEDKNIKVRYNNSKNDKKNKNTIIKRKNNIDKIIQSNYSKRKSESNKNLETYNFNTKKITKNKSSLSFGDIDEENNEEYLNDNNDSSYISKIESKYVSMYDNDEELKELKEIRNDLKSPVCTHNNRNYNRLISSFSINNNDNDNDNENENNDNIKQTSILFQLKKMASKNNYENKIINNPIVFDDQLELSFHEDLNKKSAIQNQNKNYIMKEIINYNNDRYNLKKIKLYIEDKICISKLEILRNKKYCFYYKNDLDIIKKINNNIILDSIQIKHIKNKGNNIKTNNENLVYNYCNKRIKNNENDKLKKNINTKSKAHQIDSIINNKEEKYIYNNLSYKIINQENISLKNNYFLNNSNELNKLTFKIIND